MEASVRLVRIVWGGMLAAAFLYAWVPEKVNVEPQDLDSAFYGAIVVLMLVVLGANVVLRKMTIGKAEPLLRSNQNDMAALYKWRAGQIVSGAMFEAIVLFGLVLRFVGATRMQAAPFYAVGIVGMIVFWPKPVS